MSQAITPVKAVSVKAVSVKACSEDGVLIGEGQEFDKILADERSPPSIEDQLRVVFRSAIMEHLVEGWESTPCMKAEYGRLPSTPSPPPPPLADQPLWESTESNLSVFSSEAQTSQQEMHARRKKRVKKNSTDSAFAAKSTSAENKKQRPSKSALVVAAAKEVKSRESHATFVEKADESKSGVELTGSVRKQSVSSKSAIGQSSSKFLNHPSGADMTSASKDVVPSSKPDIATSGDNLKASTSTCPIFRDEMVDVTFKNGNQYVGRVSRKLMEGTGHYIWSDGRSYKGEFEDGKMTGKGQFEWADLNAYCGDMVCGWRHGKGSFVFYDVNTAYEGDWLWGVKNGNGISLYNWKLTDWYCGAWHNDRFDGYGSRQYCDGGFYIGDFRLGRRHGSGALLWPNNDLYRGSWRYGVMDGYGEYIWSLTMSKGLNMNPGNMHLGGFLHGLRHGIAHLHISHGCSIQGVWVDDIKQGPATIVSGNGMVIHGNPLFIDDRPLPKEVPVVKHASGTALATRSRDSFDGEPTKVPRKGNKPFSHSTIEILNQPEVLEEDFSLWANELPLKQPDHEIDLSYHVARLRAFKYSKVSTSSQTDGLPSAFPFVDLPEYISDLEELEEEPPVPLPEPVKASNLHTKKAKSVATKIRKTSLFMKGRDGQKGADASLAAEATKVSKKAATYFGDSAKRQSEDSKDPMRLDRPGGSESQDVSKLAQTPSLVETTGRKKDSLVDQDAARNTRFTSVPDPDTPTRRSLDSQIEQDYSRQKINSSTDTDERSRRSMDSQIEQMFQKPARNSDTKLGDERNLRSTDSQLEHNHDRKSSGAFDLDAHYFAKFGSKPNEPDADVRKDRSLDGQVDQDLASKSARKSSPSEGSVRKRRSLEVQVDECLPQGARQASADDVASKRWSVEAQVDPNAPEGQATTPQAPASRGYPDSPSESGCKMGNRDCLSFETVPGHIALMKSKDSMSTQLLKGLDKLYLADSSHRPSSESLMRSALKLPGLQFFTQTPLSWYENSEMAANVSELEILFPPNPKEPTRRVKRRVSNHGSNNTTMLIVIATPYHVPLFDNMRETDFEEKWIRKVIMNHLTVLREIYEKYATLGSEGRSHLKPLMPRMAMWLFYRDCGFHLRGLSLSAIDDLLAARPDSGVTARHCPMERVYFWQFLHSLLDISWVLYGRYGIHGRLDRGQLAGALDKLIVDDVIPNTYDCVHASVFMDHLNLVPLDNAFHLYASQAEPYTARDFLCNVFPKDNPSTSNSHFHEIASNHENNRFHQNVRCLPVEVLNGSNFFSLGSVPLFLSGKQLLLGGEVCQLPARLASLGGVGPKAIVKILAKECPPIVEDGLIVNMDYPLSFVEWYEVVILCATAVIQWEQVGYQKRVAKEERRQELLQQAELEQERLRLRLHSITSAGSDSRTKRTTSLRHHGSVTKSSSHGAGLLSKPKTLPR